MKNNMKKSVILDKINLIMSIVFFIAVILIGVMLYQDINLLSVVYYVTTPQNITLGCENLSLYLTCNCLSENVEEIYFYNSSQSGELISFEKLIREGGVCSHYAQIFYDAGKELGFRAKKQYIRMNGTSAHMITILSDADSYCILDNYFSECSRGCENE